MRVGLSTTAIFGDLSAYFFGILRDKASNIFGDLGGYVFKNFRDTASNIIMTICSPLSVGN